ncbi:MAG: S-layer homology domain-containing protein, partial [Clostridia bacterium]|nr:S-layer homology domain-containing protein [Clostridia bacterium]
EGKTYTDAKTEVIPALGHEYELSGWTWADDFTSATATFKDKNGGADITADAFLTTATTEKPSCEETGEAVCTASVIFDGKTYTDTRTKTLAKTGHKWGEPVWKWSGYAAAEAVFTCKNNAEHVHTAAAAIVDKRTDATADATGSIVYTATVEFEGKTYTDAKTEVIPALGHEYELSGWTWADDFTSATAAFKDKNGGADITADADVTAAETAKPSCEEEGEAVYTASVILDGKTYTDTKTETLPALDHDWDKPVFVWSKDKTSAKATVTCRNDASHVREFNTMIQTDSQQLPGLTTVIRVATVVIDGVTYRDVDRDFIPVWSPRIPVQEKETQKKDDSPEETPAEPGLPFEDVKPEDPFYDDVKYVYDREIMNGVSATAFDPLATLSRSMIVTVLYRMEGRPEVTQTGTFRDVPADTWYSDSVEWAASHGIVLGYGDGIYGPQNHVTREQLAAILNRYADYKQYAIKTGDLDAADADSVSGWAAENVKWAAANGILEADAGGNLHPTEPASRAEIAGAIRAFLEEVAG